MVHAIEAYASKSANNNPLSKMLAREALRLLGANIETAVFDGSNLEARGDAARLDAGRPGFRQFAGRRRACARLSDRRHLPCPARASNALVLPHVLRFNMAEAPMLYAEIAADAFPALAGEAGSQARTAAFIDALASLSARLGLQQRLRDVGIGRQHLPKLAADAMKQTRLLVNNPRTVERSDALDIYEAAW